MTFSASLLVLVLLSVTRAQQEGELRLVNGPTIYEGRVEIYHNNVWGTVCDDKFDSRDGQVVCTQLGYGKLEQAYGKAKYGTGSGQIWLDGLDCVGNELKLAACSFDFTRKRWGYHDCKHVEDAGVRCGPLNAKPAVDELPLRITCPPNHGQSCKACPDEYADKCSEKLQVRGILEGKYEGAWYPISGQGWSPSHARTACGQLGYPQPWPSPSLKSIWPYPNQQYRSRALFQNLKCSGFEATLLNCSFTKVAPSNNPSQKIVTLACGIVPARTEECLGASTKKELYRLRAGPLPWIGRVEVKSAAGWATVCDRGWEIKEANIVCRGLGYGTAKKVFFRGHFGRGVGLMNYTDLQCRGNEKELRSCPFSNKANSACPDHSGDAGVICHSPQPTEQCPRIVSSRLSKITYQANGLTHTRKFIEVLHNGVWGRVCFDVVDVHVGTVACRENEGLFAARVESVKSGAGTGYSGTHFAGEIDCMGDELKMSKCKRTLTIRQDCPTGYTVVYCTESLPDLVPSLSQFKNSLQYYPYIDRRPMYYLQCALDDDCLPAAAFGQPNHHVRELLRFNSLTMNLGTQDFRPNTNQEDWIWHNCHQHYHSFESFIHYDILDVNMKEVAEGHKASFCLEDSSCLAGASPSYRCSSGVQGISVNCGDLYARHLDCQWIDITGLSPGRYIVRQRVNPNRYVAESDYRNNVISCMIDYSGLWYRQFNCALSDH